MGKSYSIHNALDFTISLSDWRDAFGLSRYVIKQYENFAVSEAIEPALEIEISDSWVDDWLPTEQTCFSVDDNTLVWKGGFSTTGSYKQARWRVMVDGLFTDHTTVRIVCNLPAYLVITGKVIDQVLALLLVTNGFPLVHAACVENESGGYLIAGSSGTGKTSATLFLMEKGFRFLGDNFAIIKDGAAMSFLSPLNVFSYNLVGPLRQRLDRSGMFQLWWRRLLFALTRGYVKLFVKVNPVKIWPELIGESAPLRTILLLVSGRQFDVASVGRDEIIGCLLYNMKLELEELGTWMTHYTYVFPGFSEWDWWGEYLNILLKNTPESARCLRVEVPRHFDSTVSQSIHSLLDETLNAC